MATTKTKKAPAKKAPTKKVVAKKAAIKKPVAKKTVRSSTAGRRPFITRTDDFTQLTWILFSIWLILIVVFLGTVIGKTA